MPGSEHDEEAGSGEDALQAGAGGEVADSMADLKVSVAFTVLEELCKEGMIPSTQMEMLKGKYFKQHELVLQTYQNEKDFLKKAKDLHHKLLSEKIKLEKATIEAQEAQSKSAGLKKEIQVLDSELELALEKEAILELKVSELQNEKQELTDQIAAKKAADQAALQPLLEKLEADIALQKEEVTNLQKQKKEKEMSQTIKVAAVAKLKEDLETTQLILLEQHERELSKIKNEPHRIRKQVEKYQVAFTNMTETNTTTLAELAKTESEIEKVSEKRRETEELRSKAVLRLQLMSDSVLSSTNAAEDVRRRLEKEKALYSDTVAKRVGLDMELRAVSEDIRHGLDEKSNKEKLLDRLKRDFRRKQSQLDTISNSIPPIIAQKEELLKEIKRREDENKKQNELLEEIQMEIEVFVSAYLKQEQIEKDKKDELEVLVSGFAEMRNDLVDLKTQNSEWEKHLKFLEQSRDKLLRDEGIATKLSKEAWETVQMRGLEEFDLKKRLNDLNLRQKEFSVAYEVVKNERNKYVALIQAGSQRLSEMREKLKVLQNEVEILKLESSGKDKTISETKVKVLKQRVLRDKLRMELTKVVGKINTSNQAVELYVGEIDKLNTVVNQIEREIVGLKREYETAIQERNGCGIQLIDRNDELCILWEKSNVHELLLKKGELAIQAKAENLRTCRIDLAELNRRMVSMCRRVSNSAEYAEKILLLKDQLRDVRQRGEELSAELENPSSKTRKWRFLAGSHDPDLETLQAKRQWLEERLNAKEERLLEKELIVEEVTALSEKLRVQAIEGRQGTLKMSQKVNHFQARMKELTRGMMAVVSELSMYQATSLKLKQEAQLLQDAASEARVNLKQGLPPTERSEQEFRKHLVQEEQRKIDLQQAFARRQEEAILQSNATRTTAEPRVNAYIPDEAFGLPKAYGKNTPFMPSQPGSSMRHIRKPEPKAVEI